MRRPGRVRLGRVAWGGLFLQALHHPERRQGIGFAAAMAPAVDLWTGDRRRDFLVRHVQNFNTNPALAGPILGAVVRLEERAAGGDVDAGVRIDTFKKAVEGPFAAAGDAILWQGMRGGGSACGAAAACLAGAWGPLGFLLLYNAVHLGLRVGGVWWGYRRAERASGLLGVGWFRALRVAGGWLGMLGAAALAAAVGGQTGLSVGPLALAVVLAGVAAWAGVRGAVHGTPVAVGAVLAGLAGAMLFG